MKDITRMSDGFEGWYAGVVRKAELADDTPLPGSIVIRPYGYSIWERIQGALDQMIKSSGHQNWYLPLLVPEELLTAEAEALGTPQQGVAWVTEASGSGEVDRRLAIRPSNQAMAGSLVRRYIRSHRDLPQLTNQWGNLLRRGGPAGPFLGTGESLGQEGHTFHASAAEAEAEVDLIMGYYRDLVQDWLAVPVFSGFQGRAGARDAVYSKSVEAMMRDGRSLQAATCSYLGQNLSRAHEIAFSNRADERELCYCTSWTTSTRLIGALIMAHGDDAGLILPPRLAPIQVVVVPIYRSGEDGERVEAFVETWRREVEATGVRLHVDWSEGRPAEKFDRWQLKGVPLRLEVGPKDVDHRQVTLVDRLSRERRLVRAAGLWERLEPELESLQKALFERALAFRDEHTSEVATLAQLVAHLGERGGFVWSYWCQSADCEARVEQETGGVTIRHSEPGQEVRGSCLVCGRPARHRALFARAH